MMGKAVVVLLCLVVVVVAASFVLKAHADSLPLVRAAYWVYKPSASDPSQINASDFTHLFFAWATLDAASNFTVLAPPGGGTAALQAFPSAARASNPAVKTLLSIAGNASTFSTMASSPASRSAFIHSSLALMRSLSFDGLDLDWEFPATDSDMANLASLLSEWRTAGVSSNSSAPLLLTAVVKFNVSVMSPSINATVLSVTANGSVTASGRLNTTSSRSQINTTSSSSNISTPALSGRINATIPPGIATYPVHAIARSLDWINIKAFDYHGAWEPTRTGEHTALFDGNRDQTRTTDYGVRQWLVAGLPGSQAVLGLATYGRTWYLQDPTQNIVGALAVNAGPGDGICTYDDIKAFVNSSKAFCRDDAVTKAAFCYGKLSSDSSGTLWVGFDNPGTIATKVRYLGAKKLRGYFLSSLGSDKNGDLSKQASITLLQNSHASFHGKPSSLSV